MSTAAAVTAIHSEVLFNFYQISKDKICIHDKAHKYILHLLPLQILLQHVEL